MNKIKYQAPQISVIFLQNKTSLLNASTQGYIDNKPSIQNGGEGDGSDAATKKYHVWDNDVTTP